MGVRINKETRNIVYIGKMTEEDTSKIIFFMLNENKKKTKNPINIYINSTGGDVVSTYGLVDIILKIDIPVYTYNIGCCYSAAFMLFLSGEKRFTTKHGTFMYHQSSASIVKRKLIDIDTVVSLMNKRQNDIEDFIVSRTSINKSTLQNINEKREKWVLDKDLAFQFGVVTDEF